MPDAQVVNQGGAFLTVTDFTTHKDAAGNPIVYPKTVDTFTCSEAIALGDALEFVAPTSTRPAQVRKFRNTNPALFVGVAENATTAADQPVRVVTRGAALCNVAANTPAAGDWAIAGGANGVLNTKTNVSLAATDLLGILLGKWVAAKNADNRALLWIGSTA